MPAPLSAIAFAIDVAVDGESIELMMFVLIFVLMLDGHYARHPCYAGTGGNG